MRVFEPGDYLYKEGIQRKGIVYLVKPLSDNYDNFVSANEFAEWIQMRDSANGSHLLYMDGKCNMSDNAVNLLAHAQSSNLTILTTYNNVHPMNYLRVDPNRKLLRGILYGQSYEEIRKEMAKDKGNEYMSMESDVWLFPDMEEYQTSINNLLQVPVAFTKKHDLLNVDFEDMPKESEFKFSQKLLTQYDPNNYKVIENYDSGETLFETAMDGNQNDQFHMIKLKNGVEFIRFGDQENFTGNGPVIIKDRNGTVIDTIEGEFHKDEASINEQEASIILSDYNNSSKKVKITINNDFAYVFVNTGETNYNEDTMSHQEIYELKVTLDKFGVKQNLD
ncbi:MAG: hypothetical protein KDD40_02120 [Bdellovibrionales bacterium]|nr:hypothetical protein [Bdellovibrionales bacterium]